MDIAKRVTPVLRDRGFPTPFVASACALYAATVAMRLGGGGREIAAAALAALVGGMLHGNALGQKSSGLGRAFAAALTATLAVLAFVSEPSAAHLGRALCGGVAVLAPVALVTIAAGEMARGAVESSVLRLAEASLRAAAIGLGIAAAIAVEARLAPYPSVVALSPALEPPTLLASQLAVGLTVLGGLALTVCLQARWRDAPLLIAGALVGCAAEALSHLLLSPAVGTFSSAFALGTVAIVVSRLSGRPRALIIVPGLMHLATGCFGSEAALRLVGGGPHAFEGALPRLLLQGTLLVAGLVAAEIAIRPSRSDREV
jgi:uncharacterized membrane protein YjjB (DUF3815 family)